MSRKPYRPGQLRPVPRVLTYLALLILALVYIYPFLIQLGGAFKSDAEAVAHPVNPIPHNWVLTAFRTLAEQNFARWFANSAIVALSVTMGRLVFDSMAGYALARLEFRGKNGIFAALIAVMAVPGVVLLIPKFLVLNELHMYDSYSGMIIPLIADAGGVFIMRQFFLSVPHSIEEAASIDGASIYRIYWSIVLPMAKPALITLTIFSFQGSWNELSHFIVSVQNPNLYPLTLGTANLISGQLGASSQFPIKLAAGLVMTVPVAIVFFIFQRHIMRVGEGAVRE